MAMAADLLRLPRLPRLRLRHEKAPVRLRTRKPMRSTANRFVVSCRVSFAHAAEVDILAPTVDPILAAVQHSGNGALPHVPTVQVTPCYAARHGPEDKSALFESTHNRERANDSTKCGSSGSCTAFQFPPRGHSAGMANRREKRPEAKHQRRPTPRGFVRSHSRFDRDVFAATRKSSRRQFAMDERFGP